METAVNKEKARKEAIKTRLLMDKNTWEQDSITIQKAVIDSKCFKEAEEILVYSSIRNEVCTDLIIETALFLGKKVALPKSYDNGIMEFFYISSQDELRAGMYNILEPSNEYPSKGDKGLIIMPGAAFDICGNRAGYGGGYYDRYLKSHSKLMTAAVCFSFQIFDSITYDEHDIKPDMIFTEKETIYVK